VLSVVRDRTSFIATRLPQALEVPKWPQYELCRLDRRAVEEEAERCGVILLPEEADAAVQSLATRVVLGSQIFAEQMLKMARAALVRTRNRKLRGSPVQKAHDASMAEELLSEGCRQRDWRRTR